jgi:hypothetical protein
MIHPLLAPIKPLIIANMLITALSTLIAVIPQILIATKLAYKISAEVLLLKDDEQPNEFVFLYSSLYIFDTQIYVNLS